jgi:hypothetical protein
MSLKCRGQQFVIYGRLRTRNREFPARRKVFLVETEKPFLPLRFPPSIPPLLKIRKSPQPFDFFTLATMLALINDNLSRGIKRGAPLDGIDVVVKEIKQKSQEGYPLSSPFSLHCVTSLILKILGEKDTKKLIIAQNIVNEFRL